MVKIAIYILILIVIAIFRATTRKKPSKQNPNQPIETLDSDPDAMEPTRPQMRQQTAEEIKQKFEEIQRMQEQKRQFVPPTPHPRPHPVRRPQPQPKPNPVAAKPTVEPKPTPKPTSQPQVPTPEAEPAAIVKTTEEQKVELTAEDMRRAVVLSAILERPKF